MTDFGQFPGKLEFAVLLGALAYNLLKVWPALWTFTTHAGVDRPTTPPNARCAAPSSTASSPTAPAHTTANGFAERVLSAAATCRLQDRSLFAYLRELITAHNRGDPLP